MIGEILGKLGLKVEIEETNKMRGEKNKMRGKKRKWS